MKQGKSMLKFRVWDSVSKKMEYFSFGDTGIIDNIMDDHHVMLSSGKLDKKGKEIYDGDKIHFRMQEVSERDESKDSIKEDTCSVIFEDAAFFLEISPYRKDYLCEYNVQSWAMLEFEVVGNIYE